jgi:hypothetical protein
VEEYKNFDEDLFDCQVMSEKITIPTIKPDIEAAMRVFRITILLLSIFCLTQAIADNSTAVSSQREPEKQILGSQSTCGFCVSKSQRGR